jgi:tRNAThr (cytosine32-N3)-methyltransferase
MTAHDRARALIDAAHAADPRPGPDGRPAELGYADRMEAWVARLVPDAPSLLRLAARCQHLERWAVPRESFPPGKTAYLAWRRSLYVRQAERGRQLLLAAGVPAAEADELATWVSKTGLRTNPGTQALEDAAVLVFLEGEIAAFAARHADYPDEKFVDILRKTWRKLSPRAQSLAAGLELPPAIAALVGRALAPLGEPPPAPAPTAPPAESDRSRPPAGPVSGGPAALPS